MNAPIMLKHLEAVLRDRAETYGDPAVFFEAVAKRWSLTLGVPVTPAQVVLCQLDVKHQRLVHNPTHLDSITDTAGYAAVLAEVTQ
jgi:hypothetical protein